MNRENWTDLQVLSVDDDDNGWAAACAMLSDMLFVESGKIERQDETGLQI